MTHLPYDHAATAELDLIEQEIERIDAEIEDLHERQDQITSERARFDLGETIYFCLKKLSNLEHRQVELRRRLDRAKRFAEARRRIRETFSRMR